MKKLLVIICLIFAATEISGQQPALQEGLALKYLVQLPSVRSLHPPVIILLHGYGADERDLFEMRASFPKNYLIVAARAPYSLPAGGYQWYESAVINGRNDGKPEQLDNSRNSILKFIGGITDKYKADASEVYVIGFSQGAIMSYEAGLSAPDKIKGIGVLSGMIFPSLKPIIKNMADLKRLRIFIAHGAADERILFTYGKAAADYLKSIGLSPEFHEYAGMGHAISNDVLNDLLKWLK